MPLSIILTNDWELFGDGTGNYFDLQHTNLSNILNLLDSTSAKITIMAEVMQQLAHKSIASQYPFASDIVNNWEDIIKNTVKRGSDVQLHLHPQWLGAKYENDKWQLNMKQWAISSYNQKDVNTMISNGKNYLESLIKPANPNYECIAFRTGNYSIQPEQITIQELINNNFKCDTDVTQGLYVDGFYDFRTAYSNLIPWYISADDINKKNHTNNGILEFPIYSENYIDSEALKKYLPKLYYKIRFGVNITDKEVHWIHERDKVKNQRYPRSGRYYKVNQKKNMSWYITKIISSAYTQLDYDYLPANVFIKLVKNIFINKTYKKLLDKNYYLPVVATGHTKDIHNIDNLKWIIEGLNSKFKNNIEFWTLSQAVEYWQKNIDKIVL